MANIKLTGGNTWDTSGIYDATEQKTQDQINAEQSEKIEDIKSDLNGHDASTESIVFTTGAYIKTGNVSSVNLTPVTDATARYAIVDCKEGDSFSVSCKSYQVARAWCFIDSGNTVLSFSANSGVITETVVAPANSAKAIFNDDATSQGGVTKNIPASQGLVKDVDDLKVDVDELKSNEYDTLTVKENLVSYKSAITQVPLNSGTLYRIGVDEEYTTINSAVTAWENDDFPVATFFIRNGIYHESVIVGGHEAYFIGESKEGTIIQTSTGAYVDAPFYIQHGTFTVKNMTLIADHSGNPDFDYEAQPTLKAYGLHIDGGTVGGVVTIENCIIISYQAAAVGTGTIPNSKIRLIDCDCRSYTDYTDDTSSAQYSKLNQGCVLWHTSNPEIYQDRGTEEFDLINCNLFAKNFYVVLKTNRSDSSDEMAMCAINNTLVSGRNPYNQNTVSGPNTPTIDSTGNNNDVLNYHANASALGIGVLQNSASPSSELYPSVVPEEGY